MILPYLNGLIPTYFVNRYCHDKLGQKILLVFLYVVVSNTFIAWASTFPKWPLSFPIWVGWPPDWPGPPEDWFVSINFLGEPIRYWFSGEDFYLRAMTAIFLHMSIINVTLGLLGFTTVIIPAPAEKFTFKKKTVIYEELNKIVKPEVQPEVSETKFKQRKYVAIGLVVVLSVVAASIWLMFSGQHLETTGDSSASNEILPLSMQYTKGEKLTYAIKMEKTIISWPVESSAIWINPANLTLEVLDVENGTYTICYTLTMTQTQARDLGLEESTVNMTVIMNDKGQILSISDENLYAQNQNIFSFFPGMQGFGSYFPKNESKVGDSWNIPINMTAKKTEITLQSYGWEEIKYYYSYEWGEIKYHCIVNKTIVSMEKIEVPAGIYDIFKVHISSFNFSVNEVPFVRATSSSVGSSVYSCTVRPQMSISGYEYLEKDTCLPIKCRLTTTTYITYDERSIKTTVNIDMELTEHTR